MQEQDRLYLHQALMIAVTRRGFCAPNPAVGAVLVKDHQVVATGVHMATGHAHAEVDALNKVSAEVAQGATLYITLEPCNHTGRTPPCTDAIMKAGIQRVVYGYTDPNTLMQGKSAALLSAQGIVCDYLPDADIHTFYRSYQHWRDTNRPYVTAKIAMTLNGKIATHDGKPLMITGSALSELTHQARAHTDAILTTAKTLNADDPQLNARLPDATLPKSIYVLDTHLTTHLSNQIFQTSTSVTFFHDVAASPDRIRALANKGATCIPVPTSPQGLDLKAVLNHIGQAGKHDLWIEAGGLCFASFMQQQLLQRAWFYIAPKWVQEGQAAFTDSFQLNTGLEWRQIGQDVLCEVYW